MQANSNNIICLLLFSLSLLSCIQGSQDLRILQNGVSFGDVTLPPDSFRLGNFLTVYYQFNRDQTITMAVNCNIPNQFFALGLGRQMTGSDIWVFEIVNSQVTVTDYTGLGRARPTLDSANNIGGQESLQRLGYEITSTHTLVKFKRALTTGESRDLTIQPGLNNFIYATAASQRMIRHTTAQRGTSSVTLVDNTPAPQVTSPTPTVATPNPVVTAPTPTVTEPAPVVTAPSPAVTVSTPAVTVPTPVDTAPTPAATASENTQPANTQNQNTGVSTRDFVQPETVTGSEALSDPVISPTPINNSEGLIDEPINPEDPLDSTEMDTTGPEPTNEQDSLVDPANMDNISNGEGDLSLPANSFTLGDFLTVNYEFTGNKFITMTFRCNLPNQFFAVGFGSSMFDSDIWVFEIVDSEVTVEDYTSQEEVRPTKDINNKGKNDLERLGYEITPTYTLVKVRRALDTGDSNDKVIQPGMTDLIYATANSPTMRQHRESQRDSTTVFLIGGDTGSSPAPQPVPAITISTGSAHGDTSLPSSYFNIGNLLNVYFEFNQDDSITVVLKCNAPGQYFGVGFGRVMTGSDMWAFEIVNNEVTVADYIGLMEGRPTRDTAIGGKDDLQRLGYEITPTYTMVKVKRALNTGDPHDAILTQGWVDMIYATAGSQLMTKHRTPDRGRVRVPLIGGIQGYTLLDDSTNANDVHGILNLIAWGFLVDVGIIAVRFLRGTKFRFGSITITAQMIHSAIMWLVLIMSTTVSAVLLNQNRSIRGSTMSDDTLINFHFINGLVMMFLSIMTICTGVANLIYLKSYTKVIHPVRNFKVLHKLLGILMYLMTKINIIIGALIHKDGAWGVPVFIYLGLLLVAHLLVQRKYKIGFKNSHKVRNISQKPSIKSKHAALMAALNHGNPRERLLQDFPNTKWVLLGNRVYDLTDWTHPGGNFIIQAVVGREVGRYIYGNYALEGSEFKPHKHSAIALSQINKFYIGEVTNGESVLVSSKTKEIISYGTDQWKISSVKPVTETVAQINFTSESFKIKNFGTSLSWLGRHFKLSLGDNKSPARLYTTALSLNQANTQLRQAIFRHFDEIMSGGSPVFHFNSSYLVPQTELPLFIKNYSNANGLSKKIHNVDHTSEANSFRIEGPVSNGLELVYADEGTQAIICAGTGILPFIDFLNMFLWKNMYELIKQKAGVEKAKEINVLNIPFENYMIDLKINFFGAFPNQKEILGLDIIKKLAEINDKYDTKNFTAMIKGYSDPHIPEVNEKFSTEFLKKNLSLSENRIYIVGPPKMNSEVQQGLIELGVSKERIILV